MFLLGTKVQEFVINKNRKPNWTGKVVGYGSELSSTNTTMHAMYLIEINEGFWNLDQSVFVSTLVVHPDNVAAV